MSDGLWSDLMDCINTADTRISQAKDAVRRAQYKLEELDELLEEAGWTEGQRDRIRYLLGNMKMAGDILEKYSEDIPKLKEAV